MYKTDLINREGRLARSGSISANIIAETESGFVNSINKPLTESVANKQWK